MKHFTFLCILFALLVFFKGDNVLAEADKDTPYTPDSMSISQAIILGIVEGVTEYLPVSSTGHLILTQHLMNIGESEREKAAADAYAISIQGGAILAVLVLYRRRLISICAGFLGRDELGQKLGQCLILSFLPAAIIGLLFESEIKKYLFGLSPIAFAWIVGGVLILFADKKYSKNGYRDGSAIEQINWKQALLIGLIQCIAMWPGVSRSLATILGGVFAGLNLRSAVEYSFLLGVITLGAATSYETFSSRELILEYFSIESSIIGFITSFIVAAISIKWLLHYLTKHGLMIFGYYRICLGLIVALFIFTGKL
jgi:undecaprenyl-diphosphatase